MNRKEGNMAKSSLREIPWFRGILASPGSRTDLEKGILHFPKGPSGESRHPWRHFPASSIRIAKHGKQKKVQYFPDSAAFPFLQKMLQELQKALTDGFEVVDAGDWVPA